MRWEKGADRAVLTAQLDRKRANLEISRGRFLNNLPLYLFWCRMMHAAEAKSRVLRATRI